MDTVHGRGQACIVTVVERKTGLLKMGPIHRATRELTLERTVKLLWAERERVKTITADNGTEFHSYRELESILDTQVYFATPHAAKNNLAKDLLNRRRRAVTNNINIEIKIERYHSCPV
jgi:transposase, IS30 family